MSSILISKFGRVKSNSTSLTFRYKVAQSNTGGIGPFVLKSIGILPLFKWDQNLASNTLA